MNPPGRFLKQDPTTKLWSDIGKKKALDKTRQALREGAPTMLKGLDGEEDDEENEEEEGQKSRSKSKKREDDNPLSSSFMSNTSIGSFSTDGLLSPDLLPTTNQGHTGGNVPGVLGMGINVQNGQGIDSNQMLMNTQMQMISQQMGQWQQLANLQNALQHSGTQLDPNVQLQLFMLQMQLQNQMGQHQLNAPPMPNNYNLQNQPSFNYPQGGNISAPQSQLNEQNIAALLTALQNNASNQNNPMQNFNSAATGSPSQYFQQQMAMLQLNQQIKNNSPYMSTAAPNLNVDGGVDNNNIQNILSAATAINGNTHGSNQETTEGSTMPLQATEGKSDGTSLARSQRIGLKNSFTMRPNSHRQATNPMALSLTSVGDLNMEDADDEDMEEV